jgi:4'-phosphopantetheinyl transferase EntD
MNADTVHIVASALPIEELKRLYILIGKDVNKIEQKKKPAKIKPQIITDKESRNLLLEKVFKVKLIKS